MVYDSIFASGDSSDRGDSKAKSKVCIGSRARCESEKARMRSGPISDGENMFGDAIGISKAYNQSDTKTKLCNGNRCVHAPADCQNEPDNLGASSEKLGLRCPADSLWLGSYIHCEKIVDVNAL